VLCTGYVSGAEPPEGLPDVHAGGPARVHPHLPARAPQAHHRAGPRVCHRATRAVPGRRQASQVGIVRSIYLCAFYYIYCITYPTTILVSGQHS